MQQGPNVQRKADAGQKWDNFCNFFGFFVGGMVRAQQRTLKDNWAAKSGPSTPETLLVGDMLSQIPTVRWWRHAQPVTHPLEDLLSTTGVGGAFVQRAEGNVALRGSGRRLHAESNPPNSPSAITEGNPLTFRV